MCKFSITFYEHVGKVINCIVYCIANASMPCCVFLTFKHVLVHRKTIFQIYWHATAKFHAQIWQFWKSAAISETAIRRAKTSSVWKENIRATWLTTSALPSLFDTKLVCRSWICLQILFSSLIWLLWTNYTPFGTPLYRLLIRTEFCIEIVNTGEGWVASLFNFVGRII